MTALMSAEARKLTTTRSSLAMMVAAVAYPALTVAAAALASGEPAADADVLLQAVRGAADVATLSALVLGILAAAGEYRHGTIVPTLLAAPRRARVVAAKLVTLAGFGGALSVAASAVAVAAGAAYLSGRSDPIDLVSGDLFATAAGASLVAIFYGAIGAALGAVAKNQTAAVAGALVWVLTVENVLPLVLHEPGLERWLPGGAADRLLHLADTAMPWSALAMLAGLAGVLALAAVAVTRSKDVH